MKKLLSLFYSIAIIILLPSCSAIYNIKEFGAVGDGQTLNTLAIQRAIDKCAENGGGKVIIPAGHFLTGTIYMKEQVELHLEKDALLQGSPHFIDYPDNHVNYVNSFSYPNGQLFNNKALIFAEGIEGISITGNGTIDGSGDSPEFDLGNDDNPESRSRPCMLLFIDCKKIKITDLNLRNSAYWMQNYLGCDGIHLKGLTIFNQSNFNQDGMDIDARNVLIEDCVLDVDDDAICFKSHDRNRIVENVTVRNCTLSSNCNAFKFGTMSMGGFKNFTLSDCTIKASSESRIRDWQNDLEFIELPVTVLAGIAIESVDGAIIDNITVSDIKMEGVQTPLFVVLGNRNSGQSGTADFYQSEHTDDPAHTQPVGKISNLTFRNIFAVSHSKITSSITAFPGHYIENVLLDNVQISSMGHGTKEEASIELLENYRAYPENRMYGYVIPSSGLFVRHAKNIQLNHLDLSVRNPDFRPLIILDDVINSHIIGLKGELPADNSPAVRLVDCKEHQFESPQLSRQPNPVIQLINTPERELSTKDFITSSTWLNTER